MEKELTGKETEPSELIYFKVYKSQIPVIEQAIETAALMLGTDKSRGYCLEMQSSLLNLSHTGTCGSPPVSHEGDDSAITRPQKTWTSKNPAPL